MTNFHETSENPFCTRRVRPGAIPFLFPPGEDAEMLVERLQRNGWRGEIIGAHGSGKSALLATLIPAIQRAGRHAALVELHDGQRRLPRDCPNFRVGENGAVPLDAAFSAPLVLVVDGYEQLSRWRRFLLKRRCRRRGWGLLATAHNSVGLPELCRTAATPAVAEQIVGRLLIGQASPFAPSELAECLARRGGNLRETLFDLYDLYEQRRTSR